MTDNTGKRDLLQERLENATFEVEHALSMYASSFCTIPAEAIYDTGSLKPLMSVIETCHIYLVGLVPRITLDNAHKDEHGLHLDFTVLNTSHTVTYDAPSNLVLQKQDEYYYLEDSKSNRYWPDANDAQRRLNAQTGAIEFDVRYIGQAYGQDGSRNALDRLLKHETLQRISLIGVPKQYRLTILMLSIQPNTQLFTTLNPFAKNRDDDGVRISAGIDKLFNTSEAERTTLYEASLIRYFRPEYNKEFKDSFPSTNLKVLGDCYNKDFSAVVAEICIDELPFTIKSSAVRPKAWHIAKHDLHKDADRKMFFGM